MQHFGVPSPFLDFTYDPYMALFFAIDDVIYKPSDNEIDNYFSIYYTYYNATIFEAWENVFNKKMPDLAKGNIPYAELSKHDMHILRPDNEAYQIINNTNIINQKGLFFYNNDPLKPLEETYYDFASQIKGQLGEKKFEEHMMLDTFANCLNIHKSLIPYIMDVLKTKGITKEFVYPDHYKMKISALHNSQVRSLVTKK